MPMRPTARAVTSAGPAAPRGGPTTGQYSDAMPIGEPALELVSILFRMKRVKGAPGRPLRCAAYRVDTVLELRLEYEDVENGALENDLQRSQLFRVGDNEAIARVADRWRLTLRKKGFEELPVESARAGHARKTRS